HHLRLVLRTAAFGRHMELDRITGYQLVMDHGGGIVPGVGALAGRVGQDGGTQHVVGKLIGAAYALVDHIVDAHGGSVPTDVHADLDEDGDDTGVLADRPVTGGAHARVDQNLRHGITRCRRLLALIGLMHRLDEVYGMVVGDILQRIGNALDQIILLDNGHSRAGSSNRLAGRSILPGKAIRPDSRNAWPGRRPRLLKAGDKVYPSLRSPVSRSADSFALYRDKKAGQTKSRALE